MGGFLGFGITPGGDGIRTPIGNIYARGSGGRRAAAGRYWAEQEEQKQQADWQKALDYFQKQSNMGSGDGGPSGLNDEARAAARIGDPAWRQGTAINGIFGGQISPKAAQIGGPFLGDNPFLTPQDVNAKVSGQNRDAQAARQATQNTFDAGQAALRQGYLTDKSVQDHQNALELQGNQIDSSEKQTQQNWEANQRNFKLRQFEIEIGLKESQRQAIYDSSYGNLGPEEIAEVRRINAEISEIVLKMEAIGGDTGNAGQVEVIPKDYGQDSGKLPPDLTSDSGQNIFHYDAFADSLRGTGNGTGAPENRAPEKDFTTQKMGADFLYGMNDDQKVEKILEMVRQGKYPDIEDLHPTIQDRVTRTLQQISRQGN